MRKDSLIYVAGHRGLAGSAICRRLDDSEYKNVIVRTHDELDLRDQTRVDAFFDRYSPEFVFLAAAKVGGIVANSSAPADFLYDNLAIQTNLIHSAWRYGTKKLLFLGSSCIYPRMASQPISEDCLLTGPLESTNEWYAIAKIAGIKMAQAYRQQYGFNAISLMPTNLYGPGDNFDLQSSHVLPALIRKFHDAVVSRAPEVTVWGSGTPRREFMHVDDLASAALFVMQNYDEASIVNVGTGTDISIRELAELVRHVTGFQGRIVFDPSKPDGTPRKLLDVSKLTSLGWKATIPLQTGVQQLYEWYCGVNVITA